MALKTITGLAGDTGADFISGIRRNLKGCPHPGRPTSPELHPSSLLCIWCLFPIEVLASNEAPFIHTTNLMMLSKGFVLIKLLCIITSLSCLLEYMS